MNKLLVALSSLLLLSSNAFAEGAAAGGSAMSSILMLVAFFAIFYFLLIRPQMKRNKEQRKMISELAKGDEVMTNGGIIGKIAKIGENYTEIEIAENVIIKVQKSAVSGVLPKGAVKTN
ncbi:MULTISPECIES: preprotein translocase subunit YajC [Cysteiniphilum]|uniref:Sec translocon accessory complex subunit YajC n=1 Tax=Cysteiniphilum litorale TaxID=2056700 RepID=A0A8J2Z6T8_9GAMM|nr:MULTISPECIES: preprotein translocase subunit YajC [Cysteiniphilum]MDA0911161.1 preprotein translocase subunit YajC [Pseudomonadota bacterium]GGG07204.1 preprotein translocase subunit YajC [Cysteiniphilum litorale]